MDLAHLPRLGVGISSEPGSVASGGIDARTLDPALVHFLEYGADVARGLDEHVRGWAASGRPTTYHFLDLNLEDPDDLDAEWVARTRALATDIGAAWLCGDAGLWHIGPRDRGHQLLLPPILTDESADACGDTVLALSEATGLVVLPENPPGDVYVGPLHLLDYFARVADRSGGGLLLDCAHLAIFQRLRGLSPLTALDGFPLDRVIELHVAGGAEIEVEGLSLIDDSHGTEPLPDTWAIFEHVLARAPNLRAIVFECEKNVPGETLAGFARLNAAFPSA
ncbi:MAG: DUF692 family multinuclear iron-containing protein [Polyangia bacterium]